MSAWSNIVSSFANTTKPAQISSSKPPTHKVCSRCKEDKPRSEYYSRGERSAIAIMSMCKSCYIENSKKKRKRK